MEKKKKIIIISGIALIVLVAIVITVFVFNKKTTKNDPYNDDPSITRGKFVCEKTIYDQESHKVQILQYIYFDQSNIDSYRNYTVYTFNNEDGYNSLKEKLQDCSDTYYIDSKVMCAIHDSEKANKQISALPVTDYIKKLRDQKFTCEKQRDEAYFEDNDESDDIFDEFE